MAAAMPKLPWSWACPNAWCASTWLRRCCIAWPVLLEVRWMTRAMPARPEFIILQQAAEWWALLASNEAGASDQAKWQRWLDADPAHLAAWERVQTISGQFQRLPGAPAHAALSAGGTQGRRAFAAMLVAAIGGLALWQWRSGEQPASINALANSAYGSAVGGVRQLLL